MSVSVLCCKLVTKVPILDAWDWLLTLISADEVQFSAKPAVFS